MKLTLCLLMLILLSAIATPSLAQTGGGFDLTWSTIDSGGGLSSGGGFNLNGTVGQHDVGALSGGGFALSGGFWQADASTPTAVSLDSNNSAPAQISPPFLLLGIFSMVLSVLSLRLVSRRPKSDPVEVWHAA